MNKRQAPSHPDEEEIFLDYADWLDRHCEDRQAVHIHLSRLRSYNRRDHHIRIAANSFEWLVKHTEGRLFVLGNRDLMFIYRAEVAEQIEDAVLKLRYLFAEDPLSHDTGESGNSGFCTWYDLEAQYPEFLDVARTFVKEKRSRTAAASRASRGGRRAAQPRKPINAAHLHNLVQRLSGADLSNLLRRQSVCRFDDDDRPRVVFREIYVSIPELQRLLTPEVDLTANRWLFQSLTETLDRRVLSYLTAQSTSTGRGDFSINLNLSTLLSSEFMKFDSTLNASVRGTILIEIQNIDIFSDLGSFFFVLEFLRERGYRTCLDGLTHLTLPFVDREQLGLDLVKINWSPEMRPGENDRRRQRLVDMISRAGSSRVVLCRCDTEGAIEAGRALGIALFQGRQIDARLGARAKSRPGAITMREARARGRQVRA